jgi:hypothetical protein
VPPKRTVSAVARAHQREIDLGPRGLEHVRQHANIVLEEVRGLSLVVLHPSWEWRGEESTEIRGGLASRKRRGDKDRRGAEMRIDGEWEEEGWQVERGEEIRIEEERKGG